MDSSPNSDLEIRNEVTVYDVLVPIWRYRRITYVLALIGLIGALLYQFFGTPKYTAQITVAPVPTDLTLSQSGNTIAGLSLLSSISGSSSSEGPTDFDSFSALLQTPLIARRLERDYHVKKYIFSNSWDDAKNQWTPDKENFLIKFGRLLLHKPWHPPTDQDLADYLTKKIDTTTVGPFTVLTYDFKDPKIALAVLGGSVAETQKVIGDQQHVRATAALSFLNAQLQNNPSSMVQQALIALAIQWEQKELLAENNLDVGVEVSQPLTVSDLPTSPAALFDFVVGIGGAGFFGVMISVLFGLFISDDPVVVRAWFGRYFQRRSDRILERLRISKYRFQR